MSKSGGTQKVLRTVNSSGITHIPYPVPNLSLNVTANTGTVSATAWAAT
jgi:hypothetical protein